jgi:cytochrome c biogenesis protein CcmG, thiol:disulfide interchange protein DsbE
METTSPKDGPRARLVFVALVVAVVIIGLMPRETSSGGEMVPIAKRKSMPELSMRELSGGPWTLSEHRGKVVLVNFWASWCEPCRDETPGLVKLAAEYQNRGLDVTGVAMDDSKEPVQQFVRSYRVAYPVLLPDARSAYASAMSALPTTFLVDKQGRMAKVYVGEVSQKAVRADVDRLLAE